MLAATAATALSLDSAMTAPPDGAGPVSVTVPVVGRPPTDFGGRQHKRGELPRINGESSRLRPIKAAGDERNGHATDASGTNREVGNSGPAKHSHGSRNIAAASPLSSVTIAPLAGAALLSVTVPVAPIPASTVPGFTNTAVRTGGLIVSVAVCAPL